jgi:anti-sigma-K factor RskA
MSLETDHERWRDDLAAHLLGALEPRESADLERHVASCAECRAELRWLEPAIQALAEAVERAEPPPALRARVLAEARSDLEPGEAAAPSGLRRLFGSRGSREGAGRQRAFGLRPIVGFAAVALVAAAVAGYTIGGSGSGGETSTIVAGHAPGVMAKVVREGNSGTLHLANVQQLPNDKVLQAWVRRGSRVVSAHSLFAPDLDGRATATIPNMRGVNTVMVTAEPRGGSAQPTSAPIVSIAVPQ